MLSPLPPGFAETRARLHRLAEEELKPARELGFATAWINRRAESVPADLAPESVFPDLAALAAALLAPSN